MSRCQTHLDKSVCFVTVPVTVMSSNLEKCTIANRFQMFKSSCQALFLKVYFMGPTKIMCMSFPCFVIYITLSTAWEACSQRVNPAETGALALYEFD